MSESIEWAELLAPFNVVTAPHCTVGALRDAEAQLDLVFPLEVRSLLRFSDGLFDDAGQWHFVWPLNRILSENLVLRTKASEFPAGLLAFGDDGTGAPFCMRAPTGRQVMSWSPIDGETKVVAETLDAFLVGWLMGTTTT